MMTSKPSFFDTYRFKMDPKGRVAIPAEWRGGSEIAVRMLVAKAYEVTHFRVLTVEELESMKETFRSMDWTPARLRKSLGKLASRIKVGQINGQGKLQVPKHVVEDLCFEPGGELVLVGRETYFEIYTPKAYEAMLAREDEETQTEDDETGIFG